MGAAMLQIGNLAAPVFLHVPLVGSAPVQKQVTHHALSYVSALFLSLHYVIDTRGRVKSSVSHSDSPLGMKCARLFTHLYEKGPIACSEASHQSTTSA